MIVGAALGVSGATLQGVVRNPLADPYLLGLSSGAALGAAALFVLGVGQAEANLALPLFAFAGAILTGGAVLLAARSARGSSVTLLLTGVVLSYLIAAILSVLLLVNPLGDLQVTYWLLGGLSGATWNRDGIVFGGVLVAGALLQLYGRELNVLQLGSDVAQSVGVDVRRARVRLVFLASLATAAAVAFAGIIGFVGLVSPHVVRRLLGPNYRIVIPGAALVGAVFLAVAHDLSQVLVPATELPVGIPTAFAGVPFFLYLLLRRGQAATPSGASAA
jgi:iron complex transport system permease protein